eukprot:8132966-Pyramimonas_sp.AAC.1
MTSSSANAASSMTSFSIITYSTIGRGILFNDIIYTTGVYVPSLGSWDRMLHVLVGCLLEAENADDTLACAGPEERA